MIVSVSLVSKDTIESLAKIAAYSDLNQFQPNIGAYFFLLPNKVVAEMNRLA